MFDCKLIFLPGEFSCWSAPTKTVQLPFVPFVGLALELHPGEECCYTNATILDVEWIIGKNYFNCRVAFYTGRNKITAAGVELEEMKICEALWLDGWHGRK